MIMIRHYLMQMCFVNIRRVCVHVQRFSHVFVFLLLYVRLFQCYTKLTYRQVVGMLCRHYTLYTYTCLELYS